MKINTMYGIFYLCWLDKSATHLARTSMLYCEIINKRIQYGLADLGGRKIDISIVPEHLSVR